MKVYAVVLTLFALVQQAAANLANPEPIAEQQTDGTPITLRIKGDEFDNYYTDDDGYTCLENDNGDWVYATQGPQGNLISTGVLVGRARPPGLAQDIRPTPEARAADCIGKLCGDIQSHGDDRRLKETRRKLAITQGTVKNLVVLIRFSDHTQRTLPSESDIGILMNKQGNDPLLCPTGSVWNIFDASSYGQLDLQSSVAPWVTVSNTEAYYANSDSGLTDRTHDLIREALNLVDPLVDFTVFDNDGDSRIDTITFLHSGYAAEFGGNDAYGAGNADRMWSHKWSLYPGEEWWSDGVMVDDYNISPAVWGTSGSNIGRIGVIGHELGKHCSSCLTSGKTKPKQSAHIILFNPFDIIRSLSRPS